MEVPFSGVSKSSKSLISCANQFGLYDDFGACLHKERSVKGSRETLFLPFEFVLEEKSNFLLFTFCNKLGK